VGEEALVAVPRGAEAGQPRRGRGRGGGSAVAVAVGGATPSCPLLHGLLGGAGRAGGLQRERAREEVRRERERQRRRRHVLPLLVGGKDGGGGHLIGQLLRGGGDGVGVEKGGVRPPQRRAGRKAEEDVADERGGVGGRHQLPALDGEGEHG